MKITRSEFQSIVYEHVGYILESYGFAAADEGGQRLEAWYVKDDRIIIIAKDIQDRFLYCMVFVSPNSTKSLAGRVASAIDSRLEASLKALVRYKKGREIITDDLDIGLFPTVEKTAAATQLIGKWIRSVPEILEDDISGLVSMIKRINTTTKSE